MSFLELPRMGESMEEGELVAWLKQPGDAVKRGETVAEIGTDKVVAELPALEDFVLLEQLVQPGQTAKVGQPIARIQTNPTPHTALAPSPAPLSPPTIQQSSSVLPPAIQKLRASPAARQLARQLGVNLQEVQGSGPRGRITTQDIRARSTVAYSSPSVYTLSRTERLTAQVTRQSKLEIPDFYVRIRVNLSAALERLSQQTHRTTITDLLVKATAQALRQHPKLNAVWGQDHLLLQSHVHIGVITATPTGLVTSVVRGADRLGLNAISQRLLELRQKALSGQASSEELSGATFCISNLGMYGVEEFSAIILPPNVAILAVGAMQEEVIADQGAIRIARMVRLTVSADHRAVDGVAVAQFLQTLKEGLESPAELFA